MGERLLVGDVAREIAGGQVVVVVGAGASIAASGGVRAASWTGLLATGVERCEQLVPGLPAGWGERVRGEIGSGDLDDLLSAAEKVTRKLGGRQGGEYRRWLRETVGSLELRHSAVPECLARLGVPLVTTNYDGLLTEVTGLDPVTWRDGSRVQRVLRGDEQGIVHLHGHWRDPESVVLGIRSYEDVLGDETAQALLRALATFRSFLLVGFGAGLGDPNFAALRSWMAAAHGGSEYRHYRLALDHEVEASRAEHDPRERVTVLGYGARHEDLAGFLRGLGGGAPARERVIRRVGVGADDRTAERRYREVALRAFDIIDLANLPEHDRHLATRDLELRRLYVALQVEVEAPAGAELGEAQFGALEQRRSGRALQPWGFARPQGDGHRRVPVGQRLGATRRLVVLGDPGAGKTTLLRWLATAYLLRLAQDADLAELPDADTLPDQDWLPVLVRCRDLGDEQVTGSVDDALHRSLRKLELTSDECDAVLAMLRRRLAAGTALVLVDGLDEITDPTLRTRFCRQLEQFHVAHPQTPIVVTSRIVGYRELGIRIGRGFEHLTISELTGDEKDEFAKRWCALTELPERRAEAEAGLIRDLHATQRIEDLTGNPMLLTTMALVRRRIGKLPSRRVDLYRAAVEVLLNWRSEVDEPLDDGEALPQMRYLAYAMCDRGVQQLRQDEVVGLLHDLRQEYPQLRRVAWREPEDFLRLLERRTGILTESGEVRHDGELVPVYEFRHLTFQEYLAGLALVCGHFPGADRSRRLAERVAPLAARITMPKGGEPAVVASWREPLRLCLAACNDADADPTLLAILTPSAGEDAACTGRARAVQAARCLADEPNVSETVADEVLRAFVRYIDATDGGDRDATTLDTAARELASSDLWVGPLDRHLCAEFQRREPADRASVGRVHSFTSDALRPKGDAEVDEWIRAQVTALTSPDDTEAISAALHLRPSTEPEGNTGTRRASGVGRILVATLERAGPVAHAAAWALTQLAGAPCHGRWRPTSAELRQLHAYLTDTDTDGGAAGHIVSILGRYRFMPAASALTRLLGHPEVDIRTEAALALGELGDHRAVDPLLELLCGPPPVSWPKSWQQAGWLLRRFGEQRAFPILLERLSDPDAKVRQAATSALEGLGDERSVDPLLELLDDANADVRWVAVYGLAHVGDDRAADPLLKLLDDPQDSVRWGAAFTMHELSDERSVDPLLELLNDPVFHVRQLAVYALGAVGDERVVEPLLGLLNDTNAIVRHRAAQALGELGDKRAIRPLLESLDDAEPVVRWAAAQALGTLGDKRAVEPLLELLEADAQIREGVAEALGKLGARRAVEPLLDWLGDPDPDVRLAVVKAAGKLGDSRERAALLDRLDHPDELVRSAAARALGKLGDTEAVEPLLARLDDADVDMRAAVAEALGRLGDHRAVELLVQRLDDQADVRRAAAAALGRLGDCQAVEELLARLDDVLLGVRVAAAEALGRLGDERAVVPLLERVRSGGGDLRLAAVRALGRIGDPRGLVELRHLLDSRARGVRLAALEGLSHMCDDETDRKLLTKDVNGRQPFLDCKRPIGGMQVRRAVRVLGLSEEEVRRRYENLADLFPLRLAWPDD
ncbi:MAG: HEAT repeat domain-containing protein [Egibacteraceae bacterium]